MKAFRVCCIVLTVALTVGLLVIRQRYAGGEEMTADSFAVSGLADGVAVCAGDTVDGIWVNVPSGVAPEDIISVSSDPEVAYLVLDRENTEDRMIRASVSAISAGLVSVYVRSADGELESEKYTVNVIAAEGEEPVSDGQTETTVADGLTAVYVTPSGKKYHLRASCAGASARAVDIETAVADGYLPCKNCAMHK